MTATSVAALRSRQAWPAWRPVYPEPAGGPGRLDVAPRPRSLLVELPALVLAAFLIAFTVKSLFLQAFFIPSESMVPTLLVGDRVVVSRVSYRMHDPHRGDVVVFTSPYNTPPKSEALPVRLWNTFTQAFGMSTPPGQDFIKRVIGLPGETVEAHGGHIFVSGRQLAEPYLPPATLIYDFPPVLVPPHHLYLMGDNRAHSSDSRVFGPVDESKLIGRAVLRVWPPHRFAFL